MTIASMRKAAELAIREQREIVVADAAGPAIVRIDAATLLRLIARRAKTGKGRRKRDGGRR